MLNLWLNKIQLHEVIFMSTPVSVGFDDHINTLLTRVVKDTHTTKTDFIRQAVMEKMEDLYDIEMADKSYKK